LKNIINNQINQKVSIGDPSLAATRGVMHEKSNIHLYIIYIITHFTNIMLKAAVFEYFHIPLNWGFE